MRFCLYICPSDIINCLYSQCKPSNHIRQYESNDDDDKEDDDDYDDDDDDYDDDDALTGHANDWWLQPQSALSVASSGI